MAKRWLQAAILSMAVAFGLNVGATTARAEGLSLEKGAHISIVGNTLGERMQHDGWLEALIQARFPQDQLSFRNLAFSADELTVRLRVEGFGSPDEWLARAEAQAAEGAGDAGTRPNSANAWRTV